MLQVLLVDNGAEGWVRRALANESYALTVVRAELLQERFERLHPEVLILDISGESLGSGWFSQTCQLAAQAHTPLFLLVPEAFIHLLETLAFSGDFLLVPSAAPPMHEFRLRLRRLVSHHLGAKASGAIRVQGLVIDPEAYEVRIDGRSVELTYQEFLLLAFLARNQGKACSRQQLLVRVWGYNDIGGTRTVDIHVRRIREKLGPQYGAYIQTIRHVGYKFAQEVFSD